MKIILYLLSLFCFYCGWVYGLDGELVKMAVCILLGLLVIPPILQFIQTKYEDLGLFFVFLLFMVFNFLS